MLYFFHETSSHCYKNSFPTVSPLTISNVLQLLYKIIWENCHSLPPRRVPRVCIFNVYPRRGRVVLKYMDKKPVSTYSQLTHPGTRGNSAQRHHGLTKRLYRQEHTNQRWHLSFLFRHYDWWSTLNPS